MFVDVGMRMSGESHFRYSEESGDGEEEDVELHSRSVLEGLSILWEEVT